MAKFTQLCLQQRVVARVVHQANMVREFGIESDSKYILRERNRMRFEQVATSKRACATDGFDQPGPERFQIGVRSRRFRCRDGSRDLWRGCSRGADWFLPGRRSVFHAFRAEWF